jgi:sterol desaturase/sphingolipid hydroxylase (fatty acid hydroxylase superfamily)
MAWFSFLKGATKGKDTATSIIQGTLAGIDKLVLTDEERLDAARDTMKILTEHHKALANENTSRSITRRIIAVAFIATYLTLMIAGCIIWQVNPEYSNFTFSVAVSLNKPVMLIIIFYFGYYAVANVVKARKE